MTEINIKELNKFRRFVKCKKCGYESIRAVYKKCDEINIVENGEYSFTDLVGGKAEMEVILRKCLRCGFEWLERCKEL